MRFIQLVSEEAWANVRSQRETLTYLKEQKKIDDENNRLWEECREERMKVYEKEYLDKVGSIKIKDFRKSVVFIDQKTESGERESFIIHQDDLFNLYKIKLIR